MLKRIAVTEGEAAVIRDLYAQRARTEEKLSVAATMLIAREGITEDAAILSGIEGLDVLITLPDADEKRDV